MEKVQRSAYSLNCCGGVVFANWDTRIPIPDTPPRSAISFRITCNGSRIAYPWAWLFFRLFGLLCGSTAEVRNVVVWQGIKPALAGIALGIFGAFLASQILKSMLFGISATDPVTFILAPALLLVVAVFACYAPARRASRIDPVVALRAE